MLTHGPQMNRKGKLRVDEANRGSESDAGDSGT